MYLKRGLYLQYFLQAGNKRLEDLIHQDMEVRGKLFDIFTSSVYVD